MRRGRRHDRRGRHLRGRLRRRLPARPPEDASGPLAPGVGGADVPGDGGVLVGGDAQRVVGGDVLREPVDGPLDLRREGPEHPVPDDQDAAVVAVQVAALRGVVDAVVGRRVEDVLEGARQLADPLGVHPELVDEVGRLAERERRRVHAAGDQRQVERPDGRGGPGLAQRGGEVELLAGVVDHVAGPQDPDHVVAAVRPVVEEVLGEEHQRHGPPQHGHPQGRQFVDRHVDGQDGDLPQQVEPEAAEPHGDAGGGVLRLVPGGVLVRMEAVADHLDHGEQHEGRY